MTVLASEYMYSMQLEVRNARNWTDQMSAMYAAKGGFETALANFRNDETEYDSLDEDWAEGYTGELNNCTFETKIIDESSLINVNTADEATIARAIEYCLINNPSSEDMSDAERTAKAQELARNIVEKRPYRTPAEMAKATGMTPEILYGYTGQSERRSNTNENEEESNVIALIDITTVYSADKNVSNDGRKRVNINTADANQIQQGVNPQEQQIITQQEAQAIVDYREELNNQQNQQVQPQGQQAMQGGQAQLIPGQQGQQQRGFSGIAALLDVPAISQQTLDAIRDRITVSDEGGEQQGGPQGQQQRRININTASAEELRSLSDRIDDGIANSIINYRQNRQFNNIDELRQVKAISINDLKSIVDRVSISDDDVVRGKVNINTVSSELLRILPGMDEQKAEAIIAYRESGTKQSSRTSTSQQNNKGPFNDVGQLLNIEGIDENTFRQIVDHITYRTSTFRIESIGKSSDQKVIYTCRAIIDRSGNGIEIRYWRQY
ncbi:MAG: helix-hairpin-helix domain-containing protein [bacterium]